LLISDLRREVEYIIQDTIDPDHLIAIVNECLREDLVRVLRLETRATITLAKDEATVSYPGDIYEILLLKAKGNSQSKPRAIPELPLDNECDSGYMFFGGSIDLLRMDDKPYTLYIWYHRYPAEIKSLDDTPDIPLQYHHALKYYFLAKHHKHDSAFADEQDWWGDYLKIRSQIEDSGRKKTGLQRPRRVVSGCWR